VAGPLQVTLTASATAAPVYSPSHVLAVWVETEAGAFVKTISRHADIRKVALVAWQQKAGINDADAISGATRIGYAQAATADWDLTDRQGTLVADGTYTIRMEASDTNATTAGQNNQGTFTFVKGPQPQMQMGLSNGGFTNVTINFTPPP
jgi:flagellar hook assembly protein FlgD